MHEYLDFASRHWALFVALVIILGLIVFEEARRVRAAAHELLPTAAVQKLNRGAAVLDCRKQEEFTRGHIVGAHNLPLDGLEEGLKQLKVKRGKPVLAVGATPREASQAASILRRAGFEAVYVIKGGLAAWGKDNLPLEEGETKQAKQGSAKKGGKKKRKQGK